MLTSKTKERLGDCNIKRFNTFLNSITNHEDYRAFSNSVELLNTLIDKSFSVMLNTPSLSMDSNYNLIINWENEIIGDVEIICYNGRSLQYGNMATYEISAKKKDIIIFTTSPKKVINFLIVR